ncbi:MULTISPECIES: alpha/beta hydrolase [Mycobacteroides]|uniref:Alpha/beta hydrolase n=1 Tax=Mycobacteroides chelonae TaxID=1774 RepID=A0A1S1LTN3_MYCCH|nr:MULTISPECIES: hypothetical protein [Mycobacteroides]KRQ19275.1 hypothetical protein AOT87_26645 [Mycobacteroides sp. H003]KRQ34516.1 hypothetical protein AOT91_06395 [Mycobacteroides sp. H092]KRQ41499.1 hypothetical protein AOT92_12165 [Mycobacteroides sp. H101]KRQ43453.1 hypothetical protein AOT88_24185 [Mycobacteroides sp. H063]KRQ58085.1 hypothetical protein AOT94_14465 [Mycobacteroides sp. HXVII]
MALNADQELAFTNFATFFAKPYRTPILRRPDEYGLKYEDVYFPSLDGTNLEGWFIPADSDRLLIVNHFLSGSRYGYPGHVLPDDIVGFEVNYLPQYKTLHDAGYNILAYDLRNHGVSGAANGGIGGAGLYEYRDVIGSVRYAKSRKDTAAMKTGLFSICYGANSTIVALSKHPEEFTHIKALLALQPGSGDVFLERMAENLGVDKEEGAKAADQALHIATGWHLNELSPREYAKDVTLPTLVVQVHHDSMVYPKDVQSIYDNVAATDKKLFWIEGTTNRFDGYTYFTDHPELLLEWFDTHIDN